METIAYPFAAWESFYVIVGSSAAALTGLQFVVIALASDRAIRGAEILAFATPTVFHFCIALLTSAILSAPWETVPGAAVSLVLSGAVGVGYVSVVFLRTRGQKGYVPVLEDWLWHVVFPFIAYLTLLIAGVRLAQESSGSLFVIGAMALFLLFIGIHNAWDAATYMATERPGEK